MSLNFRIAFICLHTSPLGSAGTRDTGGMNVYVRELARELGKQGVLVDVYTRVSCPGEENLVVELGPGSRLIHCRAGEAGPVRKLDLYPHLSQFAANVSAFAGSRRLHYDLVFSHYWLSGEVGRQLQRIWGVPHVIMFHTLAAVKNASGAGKEPGLRLASEKSLAGSCDLILTATEREKEDLFRYYGASLSRMISIPCGVNTDLFSLMDKEGSRRVLGLDKGKVVLFVGRIDPIKGLDRLVASLGHLKGSREEVRLIIAGGENNGGELKRIRSISWKTGVNHLIEFRGPVEHERLPYFYNAAHVCAVTSYSESFGMAALESLSCGTPVLATDVGNLKDIIRQGETGYVLSEPASPELIGEKLDLLLSSPLEPLSIRRSVSHYCWSQIAETVIKEFTHLVTSGRSLSL